MNDEKEFMVNLLLKIASEIEQGSNQFEVNYEAQSTRRIYTAGTKPELQTYIVAMQHSLNITWIDKDPYSNV